MSPPVWLIMAYISVIIPVFNAAQYISRCVDSILKQSLIDFELILVNDGSSDGSLAMCEECAGKDSRLIVVDKPNGGASSARNVGIDRSKGDYICFVDADDYVNEHYLQSLYEDMCLDKEIDLVMHGMIRAKGENNLPISFEKSETYILEDGAFFNDVNLFKFCGPCCKLFKKSIITKHSIRFNENICFSEDFDFLANYLIYCNKIRVSDRRNYVYISYEDSVSTRIYPFDREYTGLSCLYNSLSNLKSKFQDQALYGQVKKYIAYYVSRVLTSVYEPPRPERAVRLKNLKSINKDFIQLYRDYFVPPTMNNRIFKFLYVNKCYRLFDVASMMYRRKIERGSRN